MKSKPFTRFTQLTLAIIFASFSLAGAFTVTVKAQNSKDTPQQSGFNAQPDTPPATPSRSPKNPSIVSETPGGVTLELATTDFTLEEGQAEGEPCQVFRVEGYAEPEKAGQPRLPESGTMVGIPQNAAPVLTVLEAEPVEVDGSFNVCPVGHPVFEFGPQGQIEYQGEEARRDAQVYSLDAFFPSAPAELAGTAYIRSQRVAQVHFQPFQYNPVTGKVRYFKRILVQVDYGAAETQISGAQAVKDEGAFEGLLSNSVANYEAAIDFRQAAPVAMADAYDAINGMKAKILVKQDGMLAVSYEALVSAGLDLSGLTPNNVQVFNQGTEIAIEIAGGEDGNFGPGDQIVFYGQALDQKYTGTNVYWLTWGAANGKRITTRSAAPASVTASAHFQADQQVESNLLYLSPRPDSRGDNWYWNAIVASSAPVSNSYNFTITHVDTATSSQGRLRGSIKGGTAIPRHHTRIYVNGNLVTESSWVSDGQYDFEANFPMRYLVEGVNTIKVEAPMDGGITSDQILINWFKVSYWKTYTAEQDRLTFNGESSGDYLYQIGGFSSPAVDLFDVTDPAAPVRLTNAGVQSVSGSYQLAFRASTTSQHRYAALAQAQYAAPSQVVKETPSNLKSTGKGADYLLITHSDFAAAVQPLASLRASQGLRVEVVDVQDIYDEFNNGIANPDAIRDFIAYAYQNWQRPAPQYVLLVGDGNYDPRNYLGTNEKNFIPAYLLPVDPTLIETASDNRYVTVSGTDNIPDLMIGRLPVKTSAEASAMVNKIINYEQLPDTASWNGQVLLVADNPDGAGDFYGYSDRLANGYLPEGYTPNKVYYGSTHTSASDARAAIINSINAGDLVVNYVGHGSVSYWASENLFSASSLSSLTNSGKPAFLTMLACLTGYFSVPSPAGSDSSSISEAMVKAPDKGAIASWGSSGLGIAEGQDYLNRGLFQAMFYDGQTHAGEAALQAKLYLASQSSSFPDLLDTFTLFGDPAVNLDVRPSDLAVHLEATPNSGLLDGSLITYVLTYENQGLAEASHIRIDHPLPDILSNPVVTSSDASAVQIQNSRLSWQLDKLGPGEGGTIVITGVVNASGQTTISTQASIESPIPDANPNNNVAGPVQTQIITGEPTAVVIKDSNATAKPGMIVIDWTTASDTGVLGFNIYRSADPEDQGAQINPSMIEPRNPGNPTGSTYAYEDAGVVAGQTYYYKIETIKESGSNMLDLPAVRANTNVFLPLAIRANP